MKIFQATELKEVCQDFLGDIGDFQVHRKRTFPDLLNIL